MKGGAAPVLEDTQHVTYPNLAQIENGFVQIKEYVISEQVPANGGGQSLK